MYPMLDNPKITLSFLEAFFKYGISKDIMGWGKSQNYPEEIS